MVGVSSEGAQLYHYNYFGPNMAASDDLEVAAWQECIAELDRCGSSTAAAAQQQVAQLGGCSSCSALYYSSSRAAAVRAL